VNWSCFMGALVRSACKRDPQRMTAAGCRLDAEDERERFWKTRGQAPSPLALSRRLSRPDNRLESSKRVISRAWLRPSQAASRGAIDVAPSSSASEDSLGVSE
jgi:hypothetical protein